LRCPDPSCGSMVLQGMVNKLAKDEDKEKFARFLLRAYVEGGKKTKCVQLLTVHVQWSFLVTRTMMSYAIASSIFAGMYAGSILLMT